MSEALFWQIVLITTHLVTPILAVAICLWMKRGQVHWVSSGDQVFPMEHQNRA